MTDPLFDTVFRLRIAIEEERGKKRTRFRKLVQRAWERAIVRRNERMAELLFRRMWPTVLPPRDEELVEEAA